MKNEKIKANDIVFSYIGSDETALKGITFSVYDNEWVAILGKNGSGKSTLGKILNGILLPDEGELTIDEIPLSEERIWDIREKVGMVFQNPDNQFVGATVIDDVAFGMENMGIPREEMHSRADMVLGQVGMLDYKNTEPHMLSGGQKQRVAIASILAMKPSILILDESTSMLDPKGTAEVLHIVSELKEQEKLSVLSITHDLEELELADRVLVLSEGQIVYEGIPEELFKEVTLLRQLGLDVPFSVRVSEQLQAKGIDIGQHGTMESLVGELWKLHSQM